MCLNRPKLTRTCPVGFINVVRGGSVRSNRSELTRTSPEGLLPPTSQWLEDVRCSRTFPNSLQTALEACFPFHHSGSRRFYVVEPPRTHSCRPASPFVTVIQGGSVYLNLPELTQTTVMKGEAGRNGSLESVRGGSTALNLLEPL